MLRLWSSQRSVLFALLRSEAIPVIPYPPKTWNSTLPNNILHRLQSRHRRSRLPRLQHHLKFLLRLLRLRPELPSAAALQATMSLMSEISSHFPMKNSLMRSFQVRQASSTEATLRQTSHRTRTQDIPHQAAMLQPRILNLTLNRHRVTPHLQSSFRTLLSALLKVRLLILLKA